MEDSISMLICYINKEHVCKDLKSNLEAKKSALEKNSLQMLTWDNLWDSQTPKDGHKFLVLLN